MDAVALVRTFFGALVLIGLYLTYVGWLTRRPIPSIRTTHERGRRSEDARLVLEAGVRLRASRSTPCSFICSSLRRGWFSWPC